MYPVRIGRRQSRRPERSAAAAGIVTAAAAETAAAAIAAITAAAAAVIEASVAVAGEQDNQENDPPPVIAGKGSAETTVIVIIAAHKITSKNFLNQQFAVHAMLCAAAESVRLFYKKGQAPAELSGLSHKKGGQPMAARTVWIFEMPGKRENP